MLSKKENISEFPEVRLAVAFKEINVFGCDRCNSDTKA